MNKGNDKIYDRPGNKQKQSERAGNYGKLRGVP